jgi:hypothetical protein
MARNILKILAVVPVIALVLSGCEAATRASAEAPSPYPVPDMKTIALLRSSITSAAASMGDANPADLRYYATNLSLVLQAEGGTKRSDDVATPVYVLIAHGTFTSSRPRPPGSKPPTGRSLMITLDAVTLRQLELGLGPTDPDLSNMGPAHDF